jgi:hypothetical protein
MNADSLNVQDQVACILERIRKLESDVSPKGRIHAELYDKEGNLKWEGDADNSVTNQGKNSWLGIMFHNDTQIAAWYIGIMDNSGWTAEAATDTLASHSGWNEFTNYSGNRQAWGPSASSGQSITNGTPVQFTMTGSGTLKGILVASVASGTSGTLWSTADFGSTVPVNSGDVLKVSYTVNS